MNEQTAMNQAQLPYSFLPDFQDGFRYGVQAFLDGVFFPEHDKVWTEDDIIRLVEEELDSKQYRREKRLSQLMHDEHLSYLHHLGFICGYVHQAFANTVTCHSCHRAIARRTAQPIRLLTPTGRYRDGVEVLRAGRVVYECDKCCDMYFEQAAN